MDKWVKYPIFGEQKPPPLRFIWKCQSAPKKSTKVKQNSEKGHLFFAMYIYCCKTKIKSNTQNREIFQKTKQPQLHDVVSLDVIETAHEK